MFKLIIGNSLKNGSHLLNQGIFIKTQTRILDHRLNGFYRFTLISYVKKISVNLFNQ